MSFRNILIIGKLLECLKVLQKVTSKDQGWKELYTKSVQDFSIPGDSRFPLNNYLHKPKNPQESTQMREYIKVYMNRSKFSIISSLFEIWRVWDQFILKKILSKFASKHRDESSIMRWPQKVLQTNGGCVSQRKNSSDFPSLALDIK